MSAAAKRRASAARKADRSTLKTALIRTVAWVVAVPALCAAVIVGGAVPLYLLLPDAKPAVSEAMPAPAPKAAVASAPSAKPPAEVAAAEPQVAPETADEPPSETATAASDAPPADAPEATASVKPAIAPAEAETEVATVIPTPRPEPPRPAVAEEREVAALEPPSPAQPAKPRPAPPTAEPQPSGETGGRAVILRNVTLRAGPHGRELGTLQQGTPVSVGRCDEWCEVRGPNGSGWVHSSFLVDKLPDRRGGNRVVVERRIERREPAPRDRDADWLDEGMGYGRDDGPVTIRRPQWADENDRPRVVRRYAPPPRYDEDYDPYY